MKLILFIVLSFFMAQNCDHDSTSVLKQEDLPVKIKEIYFQKWIGGQPETGSGTHFYATFVSVLPKEYKLNKVYFQEKSAEFKSKENQSFKAEFRSIPNQKDFNLEEDPQKEYGNEALEISNHFKLQPNEAVLEFTYKNKSRAYKITKIKEKELIAYPQARPEKY